MKNTFYIILLLIFFPALLFAQIKGEVVEKDASGKEIPLPGANVYWVNTTTGTTTDLRGKFELSSENISDKRLVVRFIGYTNDTILIINQKSIKSFLKSSLNLSEVQVTYDIEKMKSKEATKKEVISSLELKKAACCNLGESFETNATVDITYKDAISGSKEIQVLGLSGSYTQLLTENAPLIQGLGLTYGLNSIPGTLIESINLVKGPGSVIFGHESISGMVDVELKDPKRTNKFFGNAYVDQNLRKEINTDFAHHFNEKLSSLVSLHADHSNQIIDHNNDYFADMPLLTTISLLNKWKYTNAGWISQNSVKGLYEERFGGQTAFDFSKNISDSSAYGQKLFTKRLEVYGRTGYVIPTTKYNSAGLQYSFVSHEQKGFYGMNTYSGNQELATIRLIHNIAYNASNNLNTGFSFSHHHSTENFRAIHFHKNENIPGAFLENTYQQEKRITFITGLRVDYFENTWLFTPRGNFKYSVTPNADLRFSAGTGWKTADLLAENPGILASSRVLVISESLRREEALNYGISATKRFKLNYRKGSFGADFYRTIFSNKIIPDFESDSTSTHVFFKNLDGRAFSDNFQAEFEYEILKNVRLKSAYKYMDVYSIFQGNKVIQPYIPKHRFFTNLFYETFNRKWTMNATLQWYGAKKLPNTMNNPEKYRTLNYSPSYYTIHAQLNRVFKNSEFAIGVENILDFYQKDPILSSH